MEKTIIEETSDRRFALLIDADNVSARYLRPILKELSKYGTVTIKRIYGDWTLTLHAKWKDALLENSITPIQQFGYTQGKNATDSAMIIDAMDILYTDNVDGFCLVSSDSDFTRLASRLRESGRMVIGMGEKKTPVPFRRACDVFTTLELLVQKKNERGASEGGTSAVPKDSVEQAVVDIITDNQNNGKATGLGEIGSRLQKRYPDFDVRNYGTNLLSKLLEEFASVRITKDHSSVTVELTEGAEEKGGAEKAPEATEAKETKETKEAKEPQGAKRVRGTKRAKATEDEAAGEEPQVEEAPAEPENADKQEKPGRRSRSHRASRRVATKGSAAAEEAEAAPEAVEMVVAVVEEEAAEVPVESEEAPKDLKPGRRARADRKAKAEQKAESSQTEDGPKKRTRKAAAKQASAEEVSANHEETTEVVDSAQPNKRVRKPSPNKAKAAEGPSQEPAAQKKPAKKAPAKRKSSKKAAADTPASYILQLVTEAGAEGVMLSAVTDRVREKFKDFKVRDLGYSQMRQYMESTGQYALEKSGRNFRVRLA